MEGEYVSTIDVSTEILFVWDILKFLEIEVKLPIVVKVENAGAIFLANNKSLSPRTKNIETRHHFVREYVENGILKIVYVISKNNDADIMTKNTDSSTFWRHTKKFMDYSEVPRVKNREDVSE